MHPQTATPLIMPTALHEKAVTAEDIFSATLNILEDFNLEKMWLEETQRAAFNIVEDFSVEKARHEETQRATLNILEDFNSEKAALQDVQRAMLNILEDFEAEKAKVEVINQTLGVEIAERKQAEGRIKKLNEDLEGHAAQLDAANKELEAFAHTVAHEFKTPLTQILAYAQIVEMENEDKLDEATLHNLSMIQQSAYKMSSIGDELLLLAMTRDSDEISIEPLDMAAVVSEAKKRLAAQIEKSHANVVIPHHWPAARGHTAWIEEVWVNYIGNAIKYCGQTPRIELGADIQSDGMVRYWVQDNGPGVKLEQQSRLFAPFVRLQPNYGVGHGLGLSIVRRIVEKCGGQVGVESEGLPDKGSEFWFTLPAI